ncbi:phage tail tape measure protein [Arthrobacter sp. NyZ413]|uniref:phage tail tape measure protein n=1 Tax=Arthrobacter sp. NyZ413 TaxID=3144669 RepID=UPI003BF8A09C
MANDHVIDVKVRADTTDLSKGLNQAGQELNKAGSGFSKYGTDAASAAKQTESFAQKNKAHMESVGKDAMIMGGALVAGIGVAVAAYSEFSSRMAQVQSLSHASAAEMSVLADQALTLGTNFGLSANDVADAEIELVKAGVSVKDMLGGALPGALALAAAGQIDVGQATEIATIALTQFNLQGKDVPHVADLLAAGADKALGGVKELGDGLKQGGLVASQFGLSIDDTVGTLSAFANAGLLGSDAGTSMKTMFLALASPSKQAANAMAEVGINAYDTSGKFIGVTELAGQLHDKLGNLSDAQRNAALSTIFGSDAMRAASVLMKEGRDGIQKWIKDVNDQGFAAQQAAGKMNSLNGDFKKLQAAVDTGLIQMGAASDGFLRPVIQNVTEAVNAFNSLPEPVKAGGLAVAGLTGSGLLLGGMLLTTIPKVYETVKAVQALEQAAPRTASALGTIGKAAAAVTAAMAAIGVASAVMDANSAHAKSADESAQSLLKLNQAGAQTKDIFNKDFFDNANRKFGLFQESDINGVGEALKRVNSLNFGDTLNDALGSTILPFANYQVKELRKSISGIDDAMSSMVNSGSPEAAANGFKQIAAEAQKQGVSVENTAKSFPQYMDSLRKLATGMQVSLTDQELLNWALGQTPAKMLAAQASTEGQAKMAEVAKQATEAQAKALDDLGISANGTILNLDKLVTSMINSGLISLSQRDAMRNFEKSLDDLDASIAQNGKTLDITTEKGRNNQAAFDAISSSGLKAAEAMAKNGSSQEEVQQQLHNTYADLIAAAGKFGITGDAADTMARQVLGIPKGVNIDTAIQNYADSMAKLQAVNAAVNSITNYKEVAIHVNYTESGTAVRDRAADAGWAGTSVQASASGGAVYGAGPKGVDSERFLLAPGEHVLTDKDVDAMGGQEAVYAFRKQLHNGGTRPLYAAPAPAAPVVASGANAGALPDVNVFIGNEAIDPRMVRIAENVSGAALTAANRDAGRRPSR